MKQGNEMWYSEFSFPSLSAPERMAHLVARKLINVKVNTQKRGAERGGCMDIVEYNLTQL